MVGNPFPINAMKQDDMATTIDELMEEKVAKENIPNAVVSIVHDGEVIFEKGYGYADIDLETPVDPEKSLFRVGSISKLMTWTAVMQLVEQRKLDLDTDVNEYIDFDIPAFGSTPITLRHLLTHTPGFEDYSNKIFTLEEEKLPPLDKYVREFLPERIFPAGEVLAYSNYGTALAGYIVEQVSGIPFSLYIEENIFNKLGMDNSTFEQPVPEELADFMAKPYRYLDGDFKEASFEYMPAPAGGMSSSASEMANFMIAFLQDGQIEDESFLKEETVNQMFEQQFTHHPALNGMTLGFIEGNMHDKRILMHGGSTMMYNSILILMPEEKMGIFISYSGGNYLLHNEVLQAFMDKFYPKEETALAPVTEGMTKDLKKYTGEYHQNRKSLTTDDKFTSLLIGVIQVEADDGHLQVTHMGETHPFYELEPGVFKTTRTERSPDAYGNFNTIVFEEDAEGNMILMSDGPMTYTKAPWYETSSFTFMTLGSVVIFIIGTLVVWLFAGMIRLLRKKQTNKNKMAYSAKWIGSIYGLIIMMLLVSTIINGEIDPVYQLPKEAYGMAPENNFLLNMFPYLFILVIIGLVVSSVLIWKRKIGRLFSRIHYTFYTGTAFFFGWLFYYWNLHL